MHHVDYGEGLDHGNVESPQNTAKDHHELINFALAFKFFFLLKLVTLKLANFFSFTNYIFHPFSKLGFSLNSLFS
jgi:hypothetical protein